MFPEIYEVLAANTDVTDLIGTTPCRCYPFGEAPQGVARPYVTWQIVSGMPNNNLDSVPTIDMFSVQIDCWAETGTGSRVLAAAVRDAIETRSNITAWRGEDRDKETHYYRYSFDADWFVKR